VQDENFPAMLEQEQGNFWCFSRKKRRMLGFVYLFSLVQFERKITLAHIVLIAALRCMVERRLASESLIMFLMDTGKRRHFWRRYGTMV